MRLVSPILFAASVVLAVVPVQAFVVDISPTTDTIFPEAPLSIRLRIHLDPDEADEIRVIYVHYDAIRVRVSDSTGRVLVESASWPWPCMRDGRHTWRAELEHAIEAEELLVFGEWCPTTLPPGQYRIECELSRVGVVETDKVVSEPRHYSPPLHWEFPLTVLERDDAAVRVEYEKLWLRARSAEAPRDTSPERGHAIELIVYARVPIALPYQLELLRGKVKMYDKLFNECEAVELALYLIDADRPEGAAGLVDVFADLQAGETVMDPAQRDLLSKIVLWSIHEMHARGNPDVMAATGEIVSQYPKPDDPRPIPGFD